MVGGVCAYPPPERLSLSGRTCVAEGMNGRAVSVGDGVGVWDGVDVLVTVRDGDADGLNVLVAVGTCWVCVWLGIADGVAV